MASLLQVCLALLLFSCVHGQEPIYLPKLKDNCTDGTTASRLQSCDVAFMQTLGIPSSSMLNEIAIAVCNYKTQAAVAYYGCLRTVFESCLSSESQRLLQTDDGARDQFQYLCDHKNEINPICAAEEALISSCSVRAWNTYGAAINQIGLVQATCNYLGTIRGCLLDTERSCPNHNWDVFDTYWTKSYPPACAGGARIVPTSFLLLGACAVLLSKVATAFLF